MHSIIRTRVREIFDEIMQSEKHENAQAIDPSSPDLDNKPLATSESPNSKPYSDIPSDASILQQITPLKAKSRND